MEKYGIEKDSIGKVESLVTLYWGAQTRRAIENFPVSGITFPEIFIKSLCRIKLACAKANAESGLLNKKLATAIIKACTGVV